MSEKRKLFIRKDGTYYEPVGLNEADVQGIIEADKDIISKIEVDYDEDTDKTLVTFPLGILPIQMWEGSIAGAYCFFDYENNYLLDNTGEIMAEIFGTNKIVVAYEGNVTFDDFAELIYLNIQEQYDDVSSYGNWYAILHPIRTAGTKLYKHRVTAIVEDDQSTEFNLSVDIISTSRFVTDSIEEFEGTNPYISEVAQLVRTGFQYRVLSIDYPNDTLYMISLSTGNSSVFEIYNVRNYLDTVTEL